MLYQEITPDVDFYATYFLDFYFNSRTVIWVSSPIFQISP